MASPRSQLVIQANRGDFLGTIGKVFRGAQNVIGAIGSVLTPGGGGTRESQVVRSTPTGVVGSQTFPGQVEVRESGIATGLARIAAPVGRALAKPGVVKNAAKLIGIGALFEAGGLLFDAVTGELVGRKPRRRMNVLNPRALSRSTRRLAGFQKRATKVEKVLRRLAPPSRRRAAPPSHHHGHHHHE